MTDAAAGGTAHNAMIRVEENGVQVTPVSQLTDDDSRIIDPATARALRVTQALDRLDVDTIDHRAAILVLWLRSVGSGDASGLPAELNQLANAMALQRVGQVVAGYSAGEWSSPNNTQYLETRGWADFFVQEADKVLDADMAELKARMASKGIG